MANKLKGSCLCGASRFEGDGEPLFQGFCQCLDCRKSTSSAHFAAIGMPEPAVKLTGETKHFDKKADSGNLVERHFCPNCGSMLYDKSAGAPGVLILNAALLDNADVFKPQIVIFNRSGLPWDHLDPELPRFPAMPPAG